MASVPFSEWTREEKNMYADKRMNEMRLVNERFKQRHAEVEKDRMKAEAKNSSITSKTKKDGWDKEENIKKPEREWDKGKTDPDSNDWIPPKLPGFRSRGAKAGVYDRQPTHKDDGNWKEKSIHNKDNRGFYKNKSFAEYEKKEDSNQRKTNNFPTQRLPSELHKSFQSPHSDVHKKPFVSRTRTGSSNYNDTEMEPSKYATKIDSDRVWRDGEISEVQHKRNRVEKWVKSLNTSSWEDNEENLTKREYYPSKAKETSFQRDSYDDFYQGNQQPKEQGSFRNKERNDKYQMRGNSAGRGRRNISDDKFDTNFDNGNRNDGKLNYHRTRFKTGSDVRGYSSNLQEAGRYDHKKDEWKKNAESKSSDYSGKWDADGIWANYTPDSTNRNDRDKCYKKDAQSSGHSVEQTVWYGKDHSQSKSYDGSNENTRDSSVSDTYTQRNNKFNKTSESRYNAVKFGNNKNQSGNRYSSSREHKTLDSHYFQKSSMDESCPRNKGKSIKDDEWGDAKCSGVDWDLGDKERTEYPHAVKDYSQKSNDKCVSHKNVRNNTSQSRSSTFNKSVDNWADDSCSLKNSDKPRNNWTEDTSSVKYSNQKSSANWTVDSCVFKSSTTKHEKSWADDWGNVTDSGVKWDLNESEDAQPPDICVEERNSDNINLENLTNDTNLPYQKVNYQPTSKNEVVEKSNCENNSISERKNGLQTISAETNQIEDEFKLQHTEDNMNSGLSEIKQHTFENSNSGFSEDEQIQATNVGNILPEETFISGHRGPETYRGKRVKVLVGKRKKPSKFSYRSESNTVNCGSLKNKSSQIIESPYATNDHGASFSDEGWSSYDGVSDGEMNVKQ